MSSRTHFASHSSRAAARTEPLCWLVDEGCAAVQARLLGHWAAVGHGGTVDSGPAQPIVTENCEGAAISGGATGLGPGRIATTANAVNTQSRDTACRRERAGPIRGRPYDWRSFLLRVRLGKPVSGYLGFSEAVCSSDVPRVRRCPAGN